MQTELGARSEHAVRLFGAFRNQIVDQNGRVRFCAVEHQRRLFLHLQRRVNSGHDSLARRFFVPRRPIDLPREKQSGNLFRFQRALEFRGIDRIVLNRVPRPHHLGAIEPGDRLEDRQLHINRQRSAHAVHVDLVRVQALGLQEKLVRQFVGKLDDLVFNRGTITRPRRMNLSAVHRRTMHVLANDAMRLFGGERDIARHLRIVMRNPPRSEAERSGIHISRLPLEARPVNRASVEPRRRPGLEPASAQAKLLERFAQQNRRRFSRTPRRILLLTAVNQPVKKSPGSDDDRIRRNAPPVAQQDAANAVLSSRFSVLSKVRIN